MGDRLQRGRAEKTSRRLSLGEREQTLGKPGVLPGARSSCRRVIWRAYGAASG